MQISKHGDRFDSRHTVIGSHLGAVTPQITTPYYKVGRAEVSSLIFFVSSSALQ